LPLVQRIAELHGGEFVLQSALGEGTVATILLPVDCTADGNKDAGGGPS
jgi:signal transduction histidine kinase